MYIKSISGIALERISVTIPRVQLYKSKVCGSEAQGNDLHSNSCKNVGAEAPSANDHLPNSLPFLEALCRHVFDRVQKIPVPV